MKYRHNILIFISLVTFSLLKSCTVWVEINQNSKGRWLTISSNGSIGQKVVADFSGLLTIYFELSSKSQGNGTLTLHLRHCPDTNVYLPLKNLPLQEIDSSHSYSFDFQDIPSSDNQYYLAFLSTGGGGSVLDSGGPIIAYRSRTAYQNHNKGIPFFTLSGRAANPGFHLINQQDVIYNFRRRCM